MGDVALVSSVEVTRPSARRDAWILAAIAAVGFVLRLVAVFQYQGAHPNAEHPVIDEASYDAWARVIASGDWLGSEVFFQEPLYPYVLGALYAFVSPERIVARIAQALAWSLASVVAGLVARRAFGRASGFAAAALLSLYGPGLLFPSALLKENVFLLVFAAFAWLLLRTREADGRGRGSLAWLALGVAGGLGALLRGNMLVLLPVFVAWPLLRARIERASLARALRSSACVVAGVVLALAPVALRNRAVGGELVLTTSGAGTNLYGGNNLENPFGRATEFSFVRGIPRFEAGDWRREAERRTGRALSPAQTSAFWRDEVVRSVRERPLEHARILWNKLRLTLGSYEVPDNHSLEWDRAYVPISRAPWPGFGLVGVLGLAGIGMFVVLRAHRVSMALVDARAAFELGLVFVLYLGTVVLTVTSDRARLPLVVLLVPFAAFELVRVAQVLRGRAQRRELVFHGALLALAAFAVHWPALSESERAEDLDKRDFNLAVQLATEPARENEARELGRRLLAKHPGSARLRLLLDDLDLRSVMRSLASEDRATRERAAEELAALRARVDPIADDARLVPRERHRALVLAGNVAQALGDAAAAEARYALARAFDPDDRDLAWAHARALLALAEGGGDQRAARANAALELLRRSLLDADPRERAALELDHAQARFWAARAKLSAGASGRAGAEDEMRAAMLALRDLGEPADAPRELRIRAREVGGWLQLEIGNARAAENLFRAAARLGGGDATRLGLASALVAACDANPLPDDAAAKLSEARELARTLEGASIARAPLAALRERLERVAASVEAHASGR